MCGRSRSTLNRRQVAAAARVAEDRVNYTARLSMQIMLYSSIHPAFFEPPCEYALAVVVMSPRTTCRLGMTRPWSGLRMTMGSGRCRSCGADPMYPSGSNCGIIVWHDAHASLSFGISRSSISANMNGGAPTRWGLVPSWTKKGSKPDYFRMVGRLAQAAKSSMFAGPIICMRPIHTLVYLCLQFNARSETVAEKSVFRPATFLATLCGALRRQTLSSGKVYSFGCCCCMSSHTTIGPGSTGFTHHCRST